MNKEKVNQIWKEAETGTLECPKCSELICEDWSEHTIKDIDCEPCALFQPNDIVEHESCFLCSLEEDEEEEMF